MTVKDIISGYLKDHGYDGLAGEACSCGLEDLMPCGGEENILACEPAHKFQAKCSECRGCAFNGPSKSCPLENCSKSDGINRVWRETIPSIVSRAWRGLFRRIRGR